MPRFSPKATELPSFIEASTEALHMGHCAKEGAAEKIIAAKTITIKTRGIFMATTKVSQDCCSEVSDLPARQITSATSPLSSSSCRLWCRM